MPAIYGWLNGGNILKFFRWLKGFTAAGAEMTTSYSDETAGSSGGGNSDQGSGGGGSGGGLPPGGGSGSGSGDVQQVIVPEPEKNMRYSNITPMKDFFKWLGKTRFTPR